MTATTFPCAAPIDPSEDAMLVSASRGDLSAFRQLVQLGLGAGISGQISPQHALWGVEMAARMAAAHGQDQDRMCLAGLLFSMSAVEQDMNESDGFAYEAEALAILNSLADEGNEAAADYLQQIAGLVKPEILTGANEIVRRAKAYAEGKDY